MNIKNYSAEDIFNCINETNKKMKDRSIPDSYWKAEDELLKSMEQEKELSESILTMTSEKFHRCFSL